MPPVPSPLLVQDILSHGVDPCLCARDSLSAAVDLMTATGSGCVFILEEGRLAGILTDGDIRRALGRLGDISHLRLGQLMRRDLTRISPDASLVDAFRLLQNLKINVLPVTGEDSVYLGYVGFHDVARALSPERIYLDPLQDSADQNIQRHLARYHFASSFVGREAEALDCACGSGYGTEILAAKAHSVCGVDRSTEAIEYAQRHHTRPNIRFERKMLEELAFEEESLDVVVSLETLEHVTFECCRAFLLNAAGWLKRGGVLVASSPMLRYLNGQPYVTSPYHINEMPRAALLEMFNSVLPGFLLHFYHQKQDSFLPMQEEHTGFCLIVARKPQA